MENVWLFCLSSFVLPIKQNYNVAYLNCMFLSATCNRIDKKSFCSFPLRSKYQLWVPSYNTRSMIHHMLSVANIVERNCGWNIYKKGVIQFVSTPWPIHYALNSYDKLCNWCLISVTDCSIGIAAHFDENAVFENSLFKQSLTIEDAPRVGDNHYSLCFIRLTSFC